MVVCKIYSHAINRICSCSGRNTRLCQTELMQLQGRWKDCGCERCMHIL